MNQLDCMQNALRLAPIDQCGNTDGHELDYLNPKAAVRPLGHESRQRLLITRL
jgi:hypothetical protein